MRQWNIQIKEFKKYNHKKIVVNDHVMTTYMKVPKIIQFKNSMVNDMNQNLCGGWGIFESGNEEDLFILSRIANKEKSFGSVYVWRNQPDKMAQYIEIVEKYNLPYFLNQRIPFFYEGKEYEMSDELLVCQSGIMSDLFDLDTLQNDYFNNGIYIEIEEVRNKELKEYFNGWDRYKNNVQPWETGLILGYPVENTISLYLEGRV